MKQTKALVVAEVKRWLETVVVGLNLCPFAKKEYVKERINFVVVEEISEEVILQCLMDEFNNLRKDNVWETSLLILSQALSDFSDYNQFLNLTDMLIEEAGLSGVFQIASFHPNYQFADTQFDDPANYTNRSPYPILHILREASLEQAIVNYPNTEQIPENNIKLLRSYSSEKIKELFK